ncbi:MAG: substrate-binding domain-containing protein [Spirochaetes bacterium]|jgi:ABC-type sugar transport system substrate-binding protein|nr:substrate-binding domain-containing protein [Spirochaetota bacterium]
MKRAIVLILALSVMATGAFAGGQGEDDGERVAGIVFQADQFFQIIQLGMQAAADEYGANLLLGNSDNSPQKEIELVNTYLTGGVDAIAISPLSETASVQALEEANEEGVEIVTYNSPLGADFPVSYINSSQYELGSSTGEAAAEYVSGLSGDSINVAVLAFDSQLPEISDQRVSGFLDALADSGKDVNIVSRQDGYLAEMALQTSTDIMTANNELDLIFAANEGGTVGAVQAVRNAGRAGETVVFGTDATQQLTQFLLADDGILQAVTGQQPFEIGFQAIENAILASRGESVEAEVIVPGVLLTRERADDVRDFQEELESIMQQIGG